jgi:aspartyl-tRNA(Asn)/glutamyl-tRNA(Gln) amidotransferase subunit A
MPTNLALLSACELLAGYRSGSLSPVAATEAALAAIERHNDRHNAFLLVDAEPALAAARASEARWRAGQPGGRLDGVPTSIKDIVLTEGWPTLRGSKTIDPDGPWDEDSPAVARLRAAGAVLLGKTTTPEYGWKGVTDSPRTRITRNPWDTELTPGGSSGGASVAAALGMGALHLGTDGGGSVRIPAAFTGVVGLKPSFGRVPAYPPSPFGTLSHIGPLARSVADCALMLTVMAEPDPRDPYALPYGDEDYQAGLEDGVAGLRIAYSPDFGGQPVEPAVARLVAEAVARFSELGAVVEQPEIEVPDLGQAFRTLWFAGAHRVAAGFSASQRRQLDPGFRTIVDLGRRIKLADYLDATRTRDLFTIQMNRLHQDYDLLLLPSLPLTAFEAGEEFPRDGDGERWTDWTPFTYPFNLTGQPAISLPCGLTAAALPVGLQIVGPRFADALVLRAARAFERICPLTLPPAAQAEAD